MRKKERKKGAQNARRLERRTLTIVSDFQKPRLTTLGATVRDNDRLPRFSHVSFCPQIAEHPTTARITASWWRVSPAA